MKPTAILTKLLPLLLVLCMLLTACVPTTPGTDNGTGTGENDSHTHGEGETTGEPGTEEDTTGGDEEGTTGGEDDTTVSTCAHATTKVTGKLDATCGVAGYTGDTVCAACGEMITEGTVINPTGNHTWGEEQITKNPTCIAEGEKTQYCTVCHTATKKTPIDKVAHEEKHHILTGDNQNHILGCETCDKSETQAHTPVDPNGTLVPATCTEDAYTLYHCSLCQADYKVTQTGTAKEHKWEDNWTVTKPATCAETGEMHRVCGNGCGEDETATIPKSTTHELERVSYTAATCDAEGEEVLRCACGTNNDTKVLTKIAHKYVEVSNDGEWIHSECSACGNTVSQYTAPENKQDANVTVSEIPAEKPFEINLGGTKIEFPTNVVDDMKQNGSGSTFKAETVNDTRKDSILESETLDADEKASIAAGEIYNFEAPVSTFGEDTPVKITMPYTLNGDQDPAAIIIWYIDKNNELNKVENVAYDPDTETVTFEVSHFSFYAIVYHETQELKCSRGDHGDNLQEFDTVLATCYSNGYTVKKCSVCQRTVYTDYTNRLGHSWGEVKAFEPQHCGDSGWSTKECSNCKEARNVEFFPAVGHKAMPATCTEASKCSVCQYIVAPAKGHSWSDWVTVKEPTDVEKGTKRRNCPDCGAEEFVTLAATGNITELVFTSYQDLAEYLLHNVLGFEDGKITLSTTAEGQRTDLTVMLDVNGASYTMLIEGTVTELADPSVEGSKDEIDYAFRVLYRNGVIVFAEDGEEGYFSVTDLDSLLNQGFGVDLDTFLAVLEQAFDNYVNPYFEYGYGEVSTMLEELLAICGTELDAYFKENNISFTTQELTDLLKSIENVYVYVAMKMGYDTNLEWQGMELPKRADLVNILEAFYTKTTDASGNTIYTFDGDGEFAAAVDAIYTWFEANADKKINDLLFDLLKDDIKATLPEAESWMDVAEFIDTEFGGEMTAKALIEKLIKTDSLSTFYGTVDFIVNKLMGGEEPFSCEVWLVNNPNLTLNVLCTNTFEMSWDEMRAMFSQMLDVELGEFAVGSANGQPITLAMALAMVKEQYLNSVELALADVEVVVNADGKLLSLKLNTVVNMLIPESNGGNNSGDGYVSNNGELVKPVEETNEEITKDETFTEEGKTEITKPEDNGNASDPDAGEEEPPVMNKVPLADVSFIIDRTTDVTIQLPADLSALAGGKVTYTYDTEGNLIISGLDKDVDYEIDVSGGYQDIELKDAVTRDDALSTELGYDVYVLNQKYWHQYSSAGEYLLGEDGKYYTFISEYENDHTAIVSAVLLKDILANPALLLPAAGDAPIGKYGEFDVYSCELGDIYQDAAGVWQLIDRNYSGWNTEYRHENGAETRVIVYYRVSSAPLLAAAASLELSNAYEAHDNIRSDYKVYTMQFNAEGFVNGTVSVYAYIKDDAIYCLETAYVPYTYYYVLGEAIDALPAHDRLYTYSDNNRQIFDANGNPVAGEFKQVHLEKLVPTYYCCFDGKYFPIREYDGEVFVEIQDINAVTDGSVSLGGDKVLYLLGVEPLNKPFGNNYVTDMKVGYIHVKDNFYIAAVCFYNGDQLVELYYHNYRHQYLEPMGYNTISVKLSQLVDLDSITRREDGSYVVPKAVLDALRATLKEPGDYFNFVFEASYKNGDGKDVNEFYYVGTEAITPEISFGGNRGDAEDTMGINLGKYFGNEQGGMGGYETVANADGSFTLVFNGGVKVNVRYNGDPQTNILPDTVTKNETVSASTGLEIYDMTRYETNEIPFIKVDGKYYEFTLDPKWIVSDYQNGTPIEILKNKGYFTSINRFTPKDAPATIAGEVLYLANLHASDRYSNYYKITIPIYFKLEAGELKVLTGVDDGSAFFNYEGTTTLSAYLNSLTLETVDGAEKTTSWIMPDGTAVACEVVLIKDGDRTISRCEAHYYIGANGVKHYIGVEEVTYKSTITKGAEIKKPDNVYFEETWISEYENGSFEKGRFYFYTSTTEQYVLVAGKYYDYYYDINDWYENSFKDSVQLEEDFIRNVSTEHAIWYYVDENGEKVYVKIDSYNDADGTVTHVPFEDIGDDWMILDGYYSWYYDAEGREIIETAALVPEYYEETEIDAKTKYLYFPNRGTGYIACTTIDGVYYLKADAVTDDATGNVSYTLRGVESTVRLNGSGEFEILNNLKNYVITNGNTVTFTKEFMELFKGCYDGYLSFDFYVNLDDGGEMYLGNLDLRELLENAENGDADKYPEEKPGEGEDYYPEEKPEDNYVDVDGDGVFDYYIDADGNMVEINKPAEGEDTDKPNEGEDYYPEDNFVDADGDGVFDYYIDADGNKVVINKPAEGEEETKEPDASTGEGFDNLETDTTVPDVNGGYGEMISPTLPEDMEEETTGNEGEPVEEPSEEADWTKIY